LHRFQFHVFGLAALLVAPILIMARGFGLGAAPHLDPSLGLLAVHGAALAGVAASLRRWGSLDLRSAGRVLEPVGALYLSGVLGWNAYVAGTVPAIGLVALASAYLVLLRGRLMLLAPAAAGVAVALACAAV